MTRVPGVVVHRDPQLLADAASSRLVTAIVDAQAARGEADVVLTGGSMGIAILASVASSRIKDAIDWRRLNVWWGDERYLATGDAERNETGAREALLDHVRLDEARVHAIPGPDRSNSVEDAAGQYADTLRAAAPAGREVPEFDVVLLGMGPDAHVASLFPEHPALYETQAATVAVHGSPKPPPLRVSLTMTALNTGKDVWLLVAGADKAPAVGLALSGAGVMQAPAAGVQGRRSTVWLLDRAAATHVPKPLIRISSP